jgi:hypothetical protein
VIPQGRRLSAFDAVSSSPSDFKVIGFYPILAQPLSRAKIIPAWIRQYFQS